MARRDGACAIARYAWSPITTSPSRAERDIPQENHLPDACRATLETERLTAPCGIRPEDDQAEYRAVLVCPGMDLFHPNVPDTYIRKILGIVHLTSRLDFIFHSANPDRLTDFRFPWNALVGAQARDQAGIEEANEALSRVEADRRWLLVRNPTEKVRPPQRAACGLDWIVLSNTEEEALRYDYVEELLTRREAVGYGVSSYREEVGFKIWGYPRLPLSVRP